MKRECIINKLQINRDTIGSDLSIRPYFPRLLHVTVATIRFILKFIIIWANIVVINYNIGLNYYKFKNNIQKKIDNLFFIG